MTDFFVVYNRFLDNITEDMYLEITPEETIKTIRRYLINSLSRFEFPRKDLYQYRIDDITVPIEKVGDQDFVIEYTADAARCEASYFEEELTEEEIDILAILMVERWLQAQITSVEVTRMKYTTSEFKMTSQANHLSKLITLQSSCAQQSKHLQNIYKRRERTENGYRSTWYLFKSKYDS